MVSAEIDSTGADIGKQLHAIGAGLNRAVAQAVRASAPEVIKSAQIAARSLNIVSVSSSGKAKRKKRAAPAAGSLREAIAQAVDARYDSENITIFIDREKMPPGKESLPVLTAQRQWRHPVYGNREVWVTQRARAGWFSRAIRQEAERQIPPNLVKAIERLINDSARGGR